MANKFHGRIKAGKTDVSLPLLIVSDAGALLTGLTNASVISASYWRQGTLAPAALAVIARADLDDPHADGGFKEIDAALHPGAYLLDLPDAAVAAGADFLLLSLSGDGFNVQEFVPLESQGASEVAEEFDTLTDQLGSQPRLLALTVEAVITASIFRVTAASGLPATGLVGMFCQFNVFDAEGLPLRGSGVPVKVTGWNATTREMTVGPQLPAQPEVGDTAVLLGRGS